MIWEQEYKDEEFSLDNLKFVDDNYINNKKIYISLRSIYSTSGTTQLKHPDIFSFLSNEERKNICNIIMDKFDNNEYEYIIMLILKYQE